MLKKYYDKFSFYTNDIYTDDISRGCCFTRMQFHADAVSRGCCFTRMLFHADVVSRGCSFKKCCFKQMPYYANDI